MKKTRPHRSSSPHTAREVSRGNRGRRLEPWERERSEGTRLAVEADSPSREPVADARFRSKIERRWKTRITIRLDDDVLAWFRREVSSTGGSYQKAINLALRDAMAREPLEATLRRVLREELARRDGQPPESAYAYGSPRAALVADSGPESVYGASKRHSRGGRKRRSRR